MKTIELMNEAIVRRRAYHMEREENDPIGLDSPTELKDDGCEGYVMYTEDVYNFANEEERHDMFMHMIEAAHYGMDPLEQFVKEAAQCVKEFKDRRKK